MNTHIILGKYFIFINRESGAVLGKAQVLNHIEGNYFWVRVIDVEEVEFNSVLDLESMLNLPFFVKEAELDHFLTLMPSCDHNHQKEISH